MSICKPKQRFFVYCFLVIFCISMAGQKSAFGSDKTPECVILLHGLARTSESMHDMAEAISQAQYHTVNLDYPSQDDTIENLAMEFVPKGLQKCTNLATKRIHFVTHSMGGIVLRYYLSKKTIKKLGRVVMLSPPNQGSEVTDKLKDWDIYRWYNGPAGQQLGTDDNSLVIKMGPVNYPVGIITGNSHAFFDFWLADMIPGPGDGKVSVERAKITGMTDFIVLPYGHTFIMDKSEVIHQALYFLKHEQFDHHLPARD